MKKSRYLQFKNYKTFTIHILLIAFILSCSNTSDKKLIIVQNVYAITSFDTSPLSLIEVTNAIVNTDDLSSLNKAASIKLYVDTNADYEIERMRLNDDKIAKQLINLIGDRIYEKKGKFFSRKYVAKVGSFQIDDNTFSEYDYALLITTTCQLPNRFSSKTVIYDSWVIKDLKKKSSYQIPHVTVSPNSFLKEVNRFYYFKQLKDFISDGKIGVDFKNDVSLKTETVKDETSFSNMINIILKTRIVLYKIRDIETAKQAMSQLDELKASYEKIIIPENKKEIEDARYLLSNIGGPDLAAEIKRVKEIPEAWDKVGIFLAHFEKMPWMISVK